MPLQVDGLGEARPAGGMGEAGQHVRIRPLSGSVAAPFCITHPSISVSLLCTCMCRERWG